MPKGWLVGMMTAGQAFRFPKTSTPNHTLQLGNRRPYAWQDRIILPDVADDPAAGSDCAGRRKPDMRRSVPSSHAAFAAEGFAT